ncbi:rubrerythrin family protein [Dehalobacter sp. DCM]|uniref:rubrerythrin family protein n=1 Tax=Dehalobacter sp. DCM TaxID=2907827 RepID=UPI0030820107|nr:rubrerythrin family protein [Dehalobacter sp. DCM]
MTSKENMKESFAGESQAFQKYTAFAKKADEEGLKGAAKLFRAAAAAESIHAQSQLRILGLLNSTEENLKAGIAGETYEFTQMYPGFIDTAREEGDSSSQRAFSLANEAEKAHAALYQDALNDLSDDSDYYVCTVCGYIHKKEAPEKCPVCGAPQSKFNNVG